MAKIKIHRAPSIVRNWKRFLICGCSHGGLADPSAIRSILRFKSDFNPDKTIHVGDFVDTTAWRSGAKGTKDETADVAEDINAGLTFLDQLQPDLVFNGNHEIRLWKFADGPNALLQHAARTTISTLQSFIKEDLKAEYVESYSLNESWRRMGNFLVGHGFFYNTHAVKKHADKLGNCIFAHLHRQEIARGDRMDNPIGVCIGYLGDMNRFTYAENWESRFRWNVGWCHGEYSDDQVIFNLHQHRTPECKTKTFQSV